MCQLTDILTELAPANVGTVCGVEATPLLEFRVVEPKFSKDSNVQPFLRLAEKTSVPLSLEIPKQPW
jgi:hypothetical protein